MWELEHTQPHIWNYFLEGNLSVQKSPLPGVAIGCDHAGEQVNSEDKSREGLEGNTKTQMQETCNTWLVIHQIAEEMLEKGKRNIQRKNKHHQLKNSTIERQNSRVVKLFSRFSQVWSTLNLIKYGTNLSSTS